MHSQHRLTKRSLAGCAGLLALLRPAAAQAWPARPVTLIVPYAAGGGLDPVARLVAQAMTEQLGQQVIVDLRPGGNGGIGTGHAARAAPDGYTLLMVPAPPVVQNKLLYPDLPYDPERDLLPITRIGDSPMVLVARAGFPAGSFQELVAHARAHPGQVSAAHPGIGSVGHLTALLMEQQTGISLNTIPYGTTQRINDLMAGTVDLTLDLPTAYLSPISAGRLKALAVLRAEREPTLPAVPTTVELGYPDLVAAGWYGLFAPQGLPAEILARLHQVVASYLDSPEAAARLGAMGVRAASTTPAQFQAQIAQDYAKWGPLIRGANIVLR